jgi:hypothetical protein
VHRRFAGTATALLSFALVACGSTVAMTTGAPLPGVTELGQGDGPSGMPIPGAQDPASTGSAPVGDDRDVPRSQASGPGAVPTAAAISPGTPTSRLTPIRIGFVSFTSAAASIGADNGQTFTVQNLEKALVRELNATGGLAGRRIIATYANLAGTSNDYSTALQAACTGFSQDDQVAAVLGMIGFYSEPFEQCLADAHLPHVAGDWTSGDATSYGSFPLLFSPTAVQLDRRLTTTLSRLR